MDYSISISDSIRIFLHPAPPDAFEHHLHRISGRVVDHIDDGHCGTEFSRTWCPKATTRYLRNRDNLFRMASNAGLFDRWRQKASGFSGPIPLSSGIRDSIFISNAFHDPLFRTAMMRAQGIQIPRAGPSIRTRRIRQMTIFPVNDG